MTNVGFKRLTIQPFTATGTPDGAPIIIEGTRDKGATITVKITGLSKEPVAVPGSDVQYYVSQHGTGEIKADFGLLDIPAGDEARILGQKVIDKITYIGADTEAPYCGVLMETKNLQNETGLIGFFRGKFSADGIDAKTLDPKETFKPEATSYKFTAAASDGTDDTKGQSVAKYFGNDEAAIAKIKQQILKSASK